MDNGNNNKKSQLKELWMLLFEDPMELSDEQITSLLKAKDDLKDILSRVEGYPHHLERIQRYRARKEELSQLSTEELKEKRGKTLKRRAAYLSSVDEESVGDSFFEPSPIDSDSYIIHELLKERSTDKSQAQVTQG